MPRKIYEIAAEISRDWKKVYFGAEPYLNALHQLESLDDMYGYERAPGIIRYFLGNARTWKGEKAKAIKAELNSMIKGRY